MRAVLEPQGYRVFEAESAALALPQAVECNPDVVILEMTLSDSDGISVLKTLREWSHTPVLMLSEQCDDEAKVSALDAGASDYLTKPFSSAELLARLRVLQRLLPHASDGPFLMEGDLAINLTVHEISLKGHPICLTRKEEVLFYVLARHAGKVVTRTHLMRSVWGFHSEEKAHDLQVLMSQLRKKLEIHCEQILIETERNLGYRLVLSAAQGAASTTK